MYCTKFVRTFYSINSPFVFLLGFGSFFLYSVVGVSILAFISVYTVILMIVSVP